MHRLLNRKNNVHKDLPDEKFSDTSRKQYKIIKNQMVIEAQSILNIRDGSKQVINIFIKKMFKPMN